MKLDEPIAKGYLRKDGRKGLRNKVLVIYTVDCSSFVAQKIAEHFKHLGKDVDVVGLRDCIDSPVNIRRLLAFSIHPNVGATLIVSNGCEHTRPTELRDFAQANGRLSENFLLQEVGGTRKSIAFGIGIVDKMLTELTGTPKVDFYFKDLCVGGECGGSDFSSGLAGNPLVGAFMDKLVDADGISIFEELVEAIGLRDYLSSRAANEQARREIENTYDKCVYICKINGQYSIAPGNMRGGLTTIEEKSMGAVKKSGNRPIQGVLKIAQRPPRPGLWIMDGMRDDNFKCEFTGADAGAMMDLITLGTHFNMLVTGRGHTVGNPVTPTIKITGNPHTYRTLDEDIDINAGQLLMGKKTMPEMVDELIEYVVYLANGGKTKAEILGHCEGDFMSDTQYGDRVIVPPGCTAQFSPS